MTLKTLVQILNDIELIPKAPEKTEPEKKPEPPEKEKEREAPTIPEKPFDKDIAKETEFYRGLERGSPQIGPQNAAAEYLARTRTNTQKYFHPVNHSSRTKNTIFSSLLIKGLAVLGVVGLAIYIDSAGLNPLRKYFLKIRGDGQVQTTSAPATSNPLPPATLSPESQYQQLFDAANSEYEAALKEYYANNLKTAENLASKAYKSYEISVKEIFEHSLISKFPESDALKAKIQSLENDIYKNWQR